MRKTFACFFSMLFLFSHLEASPRHPRVTVNVPMRDGTELPTDIYLPSSEARDLPCILLRSPNGRDWHYAKIADFVHAGYAVAIQDTRNGIDAEGKMLPFIADGWGPLQDGYDTVQWLAECEYCNGKVGTYGVSALGITQHLLAPCQPPNLHCQHIGTAASSIFDHAIFNGGQLRKNQVEKWLGSYGNDPAALHKVILLSQSPEFRQLFNTSNVAHKVDVPAIHHGGWYDTFLQGTIDGFVSRQHGGGVGAKGEQKLIIGPWTHHWPDQNDLGDFKVPKAGMHAPVDFSAMGWFDFHLKGVENGIKDLPAVTYYVMGPFDESPSSGNVWRSADTWPVPSIPMAFYLDVGGRLVEESAPALQGRASFIHDPNDPVPTLGGHNLFLQAGPVDQKPIEERKDVVVFTSQPLTEDLEITGALEAIITLSTDQEDTDVAVRLCDVYPDGRSILISDGIQRLADHHSVDEENVAHKPHEVDVNLGTTSIVFAKGHRIRLSISSSNYPRFSVNPNHRQDPKSSGPHITAHNTIHLGGVTGSRLILPAVRRGNTALVGPFAGPAKPNA